LTAVGWDDLGPNDPLNPGPSTNFDGVAHPVFIRTIDLERLEKQFGIPIRLRGGRPAKHDWKRVRLIAESAWAARGDFGVLVYQRPDWRFQADMVRHILDELCAAGLEEPPFSSLKKFVSDFVKEKRGSR
jgi:hypothetical protein